MAYLALRPYSDRNLRFRFVSNVDGAAFTEATQDLDAGRDAVRRLLQDVHDAGDDEQRRRGARLAVAGAGRGKRRRQALRRRVDQRRRGARLRHRHRQHVRVLGLGRRPLLDGFGHRPFHHARRRARELPRHARWLSRHGRALPHRAGRPEPAGAAGAAHRLVRGFLRRRDAGGAALCAEPRALSRLPAAATDGERRQERRPHAPPRRLSHRPHHLGRAGHRRAALVLSAAAPGHAAGAGRLYRRARAHEPARPKRTTC